MANGKKAIFAEDLLLAMREDPEINGANFARIKQHINTAPAMELVLCKECEYATDVGGGSHVCKMFTYGGMGGLNQDDDFCSYGEKKDEGTQYGE